MDTSSNKQDSVDSEILRFDSVLNRKIASFSHTTFHTQNRRNAFKIMILKKVFTILFLISNLTLFSQSDEQFGEYYLKLEGEKHLIEYRLILNQDGTFIFHSYTNHEAGIPPIIQKYGKGKWSVDGEVISFFSDREKDFDEKYTLDLSNSRARFVTKPSRDKTDRIIKTRLKFFESEIFWIKGLDIFKV